MSGLCSYLLYHNSVMTILTLLQNGTYCILHDHLFVVWFCRYWMRSRLLSSSSILISFCIFPESLLHSCVRSNCGGYQHAIIFYCLILSVEMAQAFLYDISTFTKKFFSWGLSKISDIPAGVLIVNFQCDCIHWSVSTFPLRSLSSILPASVVFGWWVLPGELGFLTTEMQIMNW